MTAAPIQMDSHFAFGENWQSFVTSVTEDNISEAIKGLSRLLPADQIAGRHFIDVGCGSGLSMLAALRLGARSVVGIDIDPRSVAATCNLLSLHQQEAKEWTARVGSVFDLCPEKDGTFDVVYSWGVLHHTGDMRTAIRNVAALVRPGGYLVVALYCKTPMCPLWKAEKRFYSRSGPRIQRLIRTIYKTVCCAGLLATRRSPISYVRDYKTRRGMSWEHDVHDWLGGYPYESIDPRDAVGILQELGFSVSTFGAKPNPTGFLGSYCVEYVAVR